MKDVSQILEFDKVLLSIIRNTHTVYGSYHLKSSLPPDNLDMELEAVGEAIEAFKYDGGYPLSGIEDISPLLERASAGSVLSPRELLQVANTLEAVAETKKWFKTTKKYRVLSFIARKLGEFHELVDEVRRCIDADASVKDNASSVLASIRSSMKEKKNEIHRILRKYLQGRSSQALQDITFTERNGRMVLPVRSDRRNMIKGVVVGISASGATLFMEPEELIPLNDSLITLQQQEKEEINRILRKISTMTVEKMNDIQSTLRTIGHLDSIAARAIFAIERKGVVLKPSTEKTLKLINARHPLIPDKKMVPINLEVGNKHRILIVTGPNTGGKTVTLKTIGLTVLMLKMGFPLLCDPGSQIPLFNRIYAVIGDEQSVEEELSTFSAHLTKIRTILENAENHDLILIDELGTGTDPIEGSALALAILDRLEEIGAITVATTHLMEVKLRAMRDKDMQIASMEFDEKRMRPLYRIRMGVPGFSHALETAERLGLPHELVEKARNYLGKDKERLIEGLKELNERSKTLDSLLTELNEERKRLKRELKDVEKLKDSLKRGALEKVDRELVELLDELKNVRKILEHTLHSHYAMSREELRRKLKNLQSLHKKLGMMERKLVEKKKNGIQRNFKEGDIVKIKSSQIEGKVLKLRNEKAIVETSNVKIEVPLEDLEPMEIREREKSEGYVFYTRKPFTIEVDVRGMGADEAWDVVDRFLDDLISSEASQGYIIHGKGTWRLAQGLWERLRSDKRVKNLRLGKPEEGGEGVTIVEVQQR